MKTTHRPKNDALLRKASAETFRTPRETYVALFKQFPELITGDVLDPCAGDGRFIAYINKKNKGKHAIYEIRKSEKVKWKKQGLVKRIGKSNCLIVDDWLTAKRTRKFDNMITNPPFSLAQLFVEKGLRWLKPGGHVTVLHRLNWLGTDKRSRWHRKMPLKYVIVIANRPTFELDGREKNISDTYEYAWYVYQKGFTGEPVAKWCHSR